MNLTFKGWVPTVTGALSFNLVGAARHPSTTTYANVADDNKRYVISYQKRMLLDCVVPFKEHFVRWFKYEGEFIFLCIAKCSNRITDTNDKLQGTVYIFFKNEWGNAKGIVDEQINRLKLLQNQTEDSTIEELFENDYLSLLAQMSKESIFAMKFDLQRNGIITLSFVDPGTGRIKFPEATMGNKLRHIVCSQFFFFLKDIVHNHQHHQPSTDTLLDIHVIKNGDDFEWRCDTLRFLYRKVLQYKREPSEELFNSSLGILAYIKTFRDISEKELKYTKNSMYQQYQTIFPDLCNDNLKDSIVARQNTVKYLLNKKISNLDQVRNLILGILGFLMALVGLLRLTEYKFPLCNTSYLLIFISDLFLKLPILGCGIIVVSILAYKIFSNQIDIRKSEIVIGIVRLLCAFDKNVAATILLILAFISFFIAIKLGINPLI